MHKIKQANQATFASRSTENAFLFFCPIQPVNILLQEFKDNSSLTRSFEDSMDFDTYGNDNL